MTDEEELVRKGICPVCGAKLIREEGCQRCPRCGWSRCDV